MNNTINYKSTSWKIISSTSYPLDLQKIIDTAQLLSAYLNNLNNNTIQKSLLKIISHYNLHKLDIIEHQFATLGKELDYLTNQTKKIINQIKESTSATRTERYPDPSLYKV